MAGRLQLDPLVLNPGELRHNIQIQVQSNAPDPVTGAPAEGWATILSALAEIRTATMRELYQAEQFSAQVSHIITIRWPGSGYVIQGGQQVLFGSRVFKLQTVDNVMERNRVLRLQCLEINGVATA